ncbi:MAG: oxidoreductase [Bacteroidota bacterium]|nr:oxidoreductase [Bacteroidota bacterium]
MNIGVIGTGNVGQTLAAKLSSLGHAVLIGTRNVAEKAVSTGKDGKSGFKEWLAANSNVKLATFADAAASAEIVINATHGGISVNALQLAGAKNLEGKIILDLANPLDFSHGTPPRLIPELSNINSLGEEIQKSFPLSKVVKTLNTMWCGLMINPDLVGGGDHVNYLSGNDVEAKAKVKSLLKEFGWKDENLFDLGDITGARATEAVLPIWLRVSGALKTGAFNFRIIR